MTKCCEECNFYNTNRDDQPCCGCTDGENFEPTNKEEAGDYINRRSLMARLNASPLFLNIRDGGSFIKSGVLDLIERHPAADVVEVVRCKDCAGYNGHGFCNYHGYPARDDGFCSYG